MSAPGSGFAAPVAHDIVEVTVIIRCACGASGAASTESGALDELEANCAEVDLIVEWLNKEPP